MVRAIRKAPQLVMAPNFTLYEWLISPIKYIVPAKKLDVLFNFISKKHDLEILSYRYQNWAKTSGKNGSVVSRKNDPYLVEKNMLGYYAAREANWENTDPWFHHQLIVLYEPYA